MTWVRANKIIIKKIKRKKATAGKVAERSRKHWLKKYELCYCSCVNIIYGIVLQVRASLTPQKQEGKYSETQSERHTVAPFQQTADRINHRSD